MSAIDYKPGSLQGEGMPPSQGFDPPPSPTWQSEEPRPELPPFSGKIEDGMPVGGSGLDVDDFPHGPMKPLKPGDQEQIDKMKDAMGGGGGGGNMADALQPKPAQKVGGTVNVGRGMFDWLID